MGSVLCRAAHKIVQSGYNYSSSWCVPDALDADQAADLQVHLRRQGRQLATVDALIAVTALRYDLTLLTTDKDFEVIPSLRCENWRDA